VDLGYKDSNKNEIAKSILIAKDRDGNTAWFLAAKRSYITVTDVLYELAKGENKPTIFFSLPHKATQEELYSLLKHYVVPNSDILALSKYNQLF
jgi:hypothetical protein